MLLQDRKLIKECDVKENSIWTISGFLRSYKEIGKLFFAIISDQSGQIQVLFPNSIECKKESVLCVKGKLIKRKSPNLNIDLGEWELLVEEYEILSESTKILPFELIESADSSTEKTRLKYRYLDLRRTNCFNLVIKSKIINQLRKFLLENEFTEVTTPSLSVSTREGAKTFDVVFLKNNQNCKFSLSQSPQLYKQLLMMSGLEKYFQIATCFRLEDLRADRQYEFLQLDIEVSYFKRESFLSLIENMIKNLFQVVLKRDLIIPFSRISYDEALEKYGSDKPDLRYDLLLENFSSEFSELIRIKNHESCFGLYLENCGINTVEDKWIRSLLTKNDVYILKIQNEIISATHIMNSDFSKVDIGLVGKEIKRKDGCLIITTFDKFTRKNALFSLGNLRMWFTKIPKNLLKSNFSFVWVVDWPLFEYNETQKKWVVSHHLFTKPVGNARKFDYMNVKSLAYDLVLNGVELGSGSERINDLEMQRYMFEVSNIDSKEIEENFSWFLEAFNYGVPPHMGIALGLDRLTQVLLDLNSIRDVIAFPKNNHGVCSLTNSPSLI